MSKYKYYFRKPKSEIVKDIFKGALITGAIIIAASSPYFITNIIKANKRFRRYPKQRVADTFTRLKREGLIMIERNNSQIYIKLTKEGKKKAGLYQIDNLSIKKPKKWDGKWRIVIFDIAELKRSHREAFRGKLKELGFKPLQKSVWIYPFPCQEEIVLLRDFFGLDKNDIQLIVAEKIESDEKLREIFKVG
jgi:DNA-binding transcriptional regulator PaaX